VILFGAFELDEETGELRSKGRRMHLTAQPSKVLLELARRRGEVVTREELQRLLWGDATHVAFDQGLNFCLSRIRSALGDSARFPRFIETLPRRGYRFLPEVERVRPGPEPTTTDAIVLSGSEGPKATRRATQRMAAGLAFLALLCQAGRPPRAHTRLNAAALAIEAFERGQRQAGSGVEGLRRSTYSFRQAVRADPQFAEAHYALADVMLGLGERGEVPASSAFPEARREALAALALEEAPETRLVLASVDYYYDWDWDHARKELDFALRAAPTSDMVLTSFARYLSASGADADAVRAIDEAEAHTPGCDLVARESGLVRYRARRYDEAIRKLATASRLGPPHGWGLDEWRAANRIVILRVHVMKGALDEAKADALDLLRTGGMSGSALRAFADLPAAKTVDAFLAWRLDLLARQAEREYVPRVHLAELHALRGETAAAVEMLERAAAEREPSLAYSLRNPDFDSLRAEPRFIALIERVGRPFS
jgi:DNA-binding winged helix-turn-helix (wHTH) protein